MDSLSESEAAVPAVEDLAVDTPEEDKEQAEATRLKDEGNVQLAQYHYSQVRDGIFNEITVFLVYIWQYYIYRFLNFIRLPMREEHRLRGA